MKTFLIEAHFEDRNIEAMALSDKIDDMISYWDEQLVRVKGKEPDARQASKDFVISCFADNAHDTDPVLAEGVCAALIRMTANGDLGSSVLPFMRAGDMTIIYEITHIHGKTYNFRTKFDEKTSRALSL